MRDIVIIICDAGYGMITLNGKYIYSIDQGYGVGEAISALLKKLNMNEFPPLVIDIDNEDFSIEIQNLLYEIRNENTMFLQEELDILAKEGKDAFINAVTRNLQS